MVEKLPTVKRSLKPLKTSSNGHKHAESYILPVRLLKAIGKPFVRTPAIDQGDGGIELLKQILTKSKDRVG